jgi:alkylhydroperoxidase/carboxymuconolactone decarboxylase family protein YurZ
MNLMEQFHPNSYRARHERFQRLDPEFARVWSHHVSSLLSRPELDMRMRLLILVGQYTMTGRLAPLEETIGVAFGNDVAPGDVLEIILQCYVYAGQWPIAAAAEVFERVLEATPGGLDALAQDRSPDRPMHERDLDTERATWSAGDREDPRLPGFLERYGWKGIATGLRVRPGHHINMLDTIDALDPHFLQAWLDTVYEGMYSRGRLDDRTRIICVVGNTLAVGETHQSRRHMRSALRAGATPRELLEVIIQTTAIFGHPYVMPMALDDLVRITDDVGRLDELLEPDRIDDVRRIAAARAARRSGIQEMDTVV